jgi:hypothetical protein
VKSADMKFGNDQICDMADFDETSRWIGWSKNEFLHSLALETNRRTALRIRMHRVHRALDAPSAPVYRGGRPALRWA